MRRIRGTRPKERPPCIRVAASLSFLQAIVHETAAFVYGIGSLRRETILRADAPTAAETTAARAAGGSFGTTGA